MTLRDSQCQTDDLLPILESSATRNSSKSALPIKAKSAASSKASWMPRRVKRCMCVLLLLCVGVIVAMAYFGIYCPVAVCALNTISQTAKFDSWRSNLLSLDNLLLNMDQPGKPLSDAVRPDSNPSFADVVSHDFQFNISGHDVIVFLHIQKTGGTAFGKHLVRDLDLERGCQCHSKIRKRCTCLRPGPHKSETWLFSRYSTGWQCGLHADWTELTACVDQSMNVIEANSVRRKYYYITFLRDPVHRFLSEYRHVKRGATWKNTKLFCNGRKATKEEVQWCFEGEIWENPSLDEFINCSDNLAINRQTRMLADLSLVGCYNKSVLPPNKREELMLWSAKQNLNRMAFFGITEEQEKSQYLFEETFNLRFKVRFARYNHTIADSSVTEIAASTLARIKLLNHLDVQLYQYGRQLFLQRFEKLSRQDMHFSNHFDGMGSSNFSWDALE